jgi:hypothetical protein
MMWVCPSLVRRNDLTVVYVSAILIGVVELMDGDGFDVIEAAVCQDTHDRILRPLQRSWNRIAGLWASSPTLLAASIPHSRCAGTTRWPNVSNYTTESRFVYSSAATFGVC